MDFPGDGGGQILRNSYLKEMGIDVWTLRPPPEPGASESVLPSVLPSELPSVVASDNADVPEFSLCFLNYRSFAICLSLDEDEVVISPHAKHFCDDVALALNGSALSPGINNLKWPGRGRQDQSIAAAEALIIQRVSSLPRLILVFGNRAASLIPGTENCPTNQLLELHGRQVRILDSIAQLSYEPGRKRNLWQILQGHRKFL